MATTSLPPLSGRICGSHVVVDNHNYLDSALGRLPIVDYPHNGTNVQVVQAPIKDSTTFYIVDFVPQGTVAPASQLMGPLGFKAESDQGVPTMVLPAVVRKAEFLHAIRHVGVVVFNLVGFVFAYYTIFHTDTWVYTGMDQAFYCANFCFAIAHLLPALIDHKPGPLSWDVQFTASIHFHYFWLATVGFLCAFPPIWPTFFFFFVHGVLDASEAMITIVQIYTMKPLEADSVFHKILRFKPLCLSVLAKLEIALIFYITYIGLRIGLLTLYMCIAWLLMRFKHSPDSLEIMLYLENLLLKAPQKPGEPPTLTPNGVRFRRVCLDIMKKIP